MSHYPYQADRTYSFNLFSSTRPSDMSTYTTKKYDKNLQKFQSKTNKNTDFDDTNYTIKIKNDYSTIRKLPQNLSNIRQTFSYVPSTQLYQSKYQSLINSNNKINYKQKQKQTQKDNQSKNNNTLRLTLDVNYPRKKAQSYFNYNNNFDISTTSSNKILNINQFNIKSQTNQSINLNNTQSNFTLITGSSDIQKNKNKNIRYSYKNLQTNYNNYNNNNNQNCNNKFQNSFNNKYNQKSTYQINNTSKNSVNIKDLDDPIKKLKQQRQRKKNNKIIIENNNINKDQSQYNNSNEIYSSQKRINYKEKQQEKEKQGFFKKNYIQYYTPKVQKKTCITTHRLSDQQKVSKPDQRNRNDTSFDKMLKTFKQKQQKNIQKKSNNDFNNNNITKRSSFNQKVKLQDFIIGKHLGQGKFGSANLALHKRTGAIFAIKKIRKQTLKSHKLIDQFILQIKLQTYLIHPFILKIYGMFDDEQYIYIILQFMQQGTLFSYLKKNKKVQQQDTAQKIRYLAQSIKFLQDRGIAHRDIKPQNIIMTNSVCKLADFGWATFCDEQRRKTYCGTCDYVAPQILKGQQYDQTVDLWCMGVLAFELLTGRAPFYHMSRKQTMKKIINAQIQYPSHISQLTKSFIDALIKKNPQERMTIQQTLNHSFIKNVNLSQ